MPEITEWENQFVNDNFHKIAHDKDFWLGLQPLIKPENINFPVYCYVTARPVDPHVSFKWLMNHGFPFAPVFGVGSNGAIHDPKVDIVKLLELDVFVDDKWQHFEEINEQCEKTTCFLMGTSWTKQHKDQVGNLYINKLSEIPELIGVKEVIVGT